MTRDAKIKTYSLDVVVEDEKYWLDQGYTIDYSNDKLVPINN